ncbi:MAG: ATP-dependent helicase, partial [Anaerolineae bacterium]|nr:ATP-dependent helicase [Anaerolineae bacterium]
DFQIVDERIAAAVVRDIVYSHLPAWASLAELYLAPQLQPSQRQRAERRDFPEYLVQIGERFIKQAKDNLLQPIDLQEKLEGVDAPLAQFAIEVYTDYQRSLAFRGAVDFDDLVRLALEALQSDPLYLARLRERWPYILEDEAQDSSRLQEQMLHLLTDGQNWVRVGDPNQAINTTFTTASPQFLLHFLENKVVQNRPLPNSGRSGVPIIRVANELVRWTVHEHPVPELRNAFYEQDIQPTDTDDPQPNPPEAEVSIYIHHQPGQNITPQQELELVVRNLKRWLTDNGDKTVAVLVPENSRGFKLAEELRREGIPYEELLRSTTEARTAAAYLRSILLYLATPNDAGMLARLYRDVWWPMTMGQDDKFDIATPFQAISRQKYLENLIWPAETFDLAEVLMLPDEPAIVQNIGDFLGYVRRWLEALELPIDQLVLTISQDIFTRPPDIALAYKIAVLLRSMAENNPAWRLKDFAEELRSITENQRKFIGFDDATEGFDPTPGVVTVATMHAAKGLEWDRV